MLLALLLATALALAYANGANDNFKATATLYGSGAAGYPEARRLATLAQLCGSAASVVLAGALLEAFGGKGLVPAEVVGDPRFLVAVGAGAAATVLLATRVGLPISTTHALVGGLTGCGAGPGAEPALVVGAGRKLLPAAAREPPAGYGGRGAHLSAGPPQSRGAGDRSRHVRVHRARTATGGCHARWRIAPSRHGCAADPRREGALPTGLRRSPVGYDDPAVGGSDSRHLRLRTGVRPRLERHAEGAGPAGGGGLVGSRPADLAGGGGRRHGRRGLAARAEGRRDTGAPHHVSSVTVRGCWPMPSPARW